MKLMHPSNKDTFLSTDITKWYLIQAWPDKKEFHVFLVFVRVCYSIPVRSVSVRRIMRYIQRSWPLLVKVYAISLFLSNETPKRYYCLVNANRYSGWLYFKCEQPWRFFFPIVFGNLVRWSFLLTALYRCWLIKIRFSQHFAYTSMVATT